MTGLTKHFRALLPPPFVSSKFVRAPPILSKHVQSSPSLVTHRTCQMSPLSARPSFSRSVADASETETKEADSNMVSSQGTEEASSDSTCGLKSLCGSADDLTQGQSLRSLRTTSNTALLQQAGKDEAVFEVPNEVSAGLEQLKDGDESLKGGKAHLKEGPAEGSTHGGLSGLIHIGRWSAVSMKSMVLRSESAARLKGHRNVLKTIIYNPSGSV